MSQPAQPADRPAAPRRALPAAILTGLLGAALLAFFLHQVAEHRFRNDDAYISYRYARHLADGLGLVWNAGERVEGYTTFLWVVIVAGAMKLGLRADAFTAVFSPLCGTVLLFATAWFAARRDGWKSPWILATPAALVASRTFTAWSGNGMETVFFAMLAWSAWARFLVEREAPPEAARRRWSPWLFAATALARPDGLLFAGLAGGVLALDVLRGRASFRSLVAWAAPLVLLVGAHFLWRRAYYGFWWPNTFYAKVNSARPGEGLRYLAEFHRVYTFGWFLPLWILPAFDPARRAVLWLVLPVAAYAAYLVSIGGGLFEFRFLVCLLPFAFTLTVEGIRTLASFRPRPLWGGAGVATLVLLLAATWRGQDEARAERIFDSGIRTFRQLDAVASIGLDWGGRLRELVDEGDLPGDLVICVGAAGALPYVSRLKTIDFHGLNDVAVARMPVEEGRIAHEHSAPIEYLVERGVDLHVADKALFRRNPKAVFAKQQKKYQPYWKDVPLDGEYLSFASYVPEERFLAVFGKLIEKGNAARDRGSDRPAGEPGTPDADAEEDGAN